MHLHADEPVDSFKFNSNNLELSNLEIFRESDSEETIFKNFSEEDQFVTVLLEDTVVGDFFLRVSFKGEYSKNMKGFYKSEYEVKNDGKNIKKIMYSTQFEPTDARSAFPCFDQPDMKSTFSISIEVPEGNIALSNNELESNEGLLYKFKKTPVMSTYIVAWVVGDLEFAEDATASPPIRVYADKSEVKWADFSLKVARRCLAFFEKYFEEKYPLPKLDMVAIPSFASAAMENWGLITYRQTSLLFDETSTPIRFLKNMAITVCHELAHMWFGNLVTMKWWNDLWLNEGFATWAATLAAANSLQDILPWDAWNSFINDEIQSGMRMDSLESTHPIAVTVEDPIEISQIFDAISYSKGSSIIKMLEDWLGPEVFRQGLVDYIKKYSYKNAEKQDLWDCLTKRANQYNSDSQINVSDVIDPWVVRGGFPYVEVKDEGDTIILTQKRFTLGYQITDEDWPIPLKISWGSEYEPTSFIMTEPTQEISKKSDDYRIIGNDFGFYRILYSDDRLRELFNAELDSKKKMKFINDQHAMLMALLVEPSSLFQMFNYLKDEEEYETLFSGISSLLSLKSIFYFDAEKRELLNRKLLEIVSERASSIDIFVPQVGVNEKSLCSLIISTAVSAGDVNTINRLKNIDLENDPIKPNKEYIRSIYSVYSKTEQGFDKLLDLYKTNSEPGKQQQVLVALGTTDIESKIDYVFENLDKIAPHESIYLFSALSSNLLYRNKIAMLFIREFANIKKHIKNCSLMRYTVEFSLKNVIQDGYSDKVFDFLKKMEDDKEMKSAIDKTYDYLRIGIQIRDKYRNSNFE